MIKLKSSRRYYLCLILNFKMSFFVKNSPKICLSGADNIKTFTKKFPTPKL